MEICVSGPVSEKSVNREGEMGVYSGCIHFSVLCVWAVKTTTLINPPIVS